MSKKKLKIGDSDAVEVVVPADDQAESEESDEGNTVNCGATYKQFDAKAEVEEGERAVVATITTGAVDRDREVVLAAGGDFRAFQKNPVVLFAHAYWEPPIGKAMWIRQVRDKIVAKTVIAPGPRGDEILALMQGGFLRAFSIGFNPLPGKSTPPTPAEIKRKPDWADVRTVHREWNLLEYSVVPVPANPEALTMAVSKGMLHISRELAKSLGVAYVDPKPKRTVFSVPAMPAEKNTVDRTVKQVIQRKQKRVVTVIEVQAAKIVTAEVIGKLVVENFNIQLGR